MFGLGMDGGGFSARFKGGHSRSCLLTSTKLKRRYFLSSGLYYVPFLTKRETNQRFTIRAVFSSESRIPNSEFRKGITKMRDQRLWLSSIFEVDEIVLFTFPFYQLFEKANYFFFRQTALPEK
jgi:hypothetical protein